MNRAAAAKTGAYAGLSAIGLLASLVLGRPELVALSAPFVLTLVAGFVLAGSPDPEVVLHLERERAVDGDELGLEIELRSISSLEQLEVLLVLPRGLSVVSGENPTLLRLASGETRIVELRLRCDRWGGYLLGTIELRSRDRFGLHVYQARLDRRVPLKVYPRAEALRGAVRPLETQLFSGNQVARARGEGIEFADLRPFAPGDVVRRVNWRASARRDSLWVNEYHPERDAEVILFLDSFLEARRAGGDAGTLDLSIRAAASLASAYVGVRDRIGIVGFGGILRWLQPGTGLAQLYRIVDALIDTEISLSYAWKGIEVIPPGMLPPQALVLAVSPLLDERAVTALLDLRGRRFDVAVVEVSPLPFTEPGPGELGDLAYRLWALRREALRARYQRQGVAVVEWRDGTPLQAALEEVTAFRRHARFARA